MDEKSTPEVRAALQAQSEKIQQSGWLSPVEAEGLRRKLAALQAEIDTLGRDAAEDMHKLMEKVAQLRAERDSVTRELQQWRVQVKEFCAQRNTSPVAVLGYISPEIGRMMLEQTWHESHPIIPETLIREAKKQLESGDALLTVIPTGTLKTIVADAKAPLQAEIDELRGDMKAMEEAYYYAAEERDELRAAVEAVEFVPIATQQGIELCAWCSQHRDFGHAPDCQRQAVLGLGQKDEAQ